MLISITFMICLLLRGNTTLTRSRASEKPGVQTRFDAAVNDNVFFIDTLDNIDTYCIYNIK